MRDALMADELQRRRFSDQEFALILRRAQEMQEAGGDAGGTAARGGMSLDEIRQIAGEVGIEPRFVELAVDALPRVPPRGAALAGAPWEWEATRVVAGELVEGEKGRVLDAIRSVVKDKGDLETAYGRVEWSHNDELGPVLVRVVPDEGETRVEVTARRAGEVGLWYGVSVPVGTIVLGGALTTALGLDSPAAIVPMMTALALGLGAGVRVLWRGQAARWERKVSLLADRVADAVRRGSDRKEES
jgi:hypothetical protein